MKIYDLMDEDINENIIKASTIAAFSEGTIKIITCNIKDVSDYNILVDQVIKANAPIACFQQCSSDNLQREKLIRAFKAEGYCGVKFNGYDMIFNRKDAIPIKKEYINFANTLQGRGVIVYTYRLWYPIIWSRGPSTQVTIKICTSTLESGGTGGGIRKAQIRDIDNIIMSSSPVGDINIFAGDANILSWQTELSRCTPGTSEGIGSTSRSPDSKNIWKDAWREKGTCENEYTEKFDRPDRVWYTERVGFENELRCLSYEFFFPHGTCEPVAKNLRKGVIVEFSY
jgi:hypothetical protein